MSDLLASLASWVSFILRSVVGGHVEEGGQLYNSIIGRLFENHYSSGSLAYQVAAKAIPFILLFVIAPIVLYALVGIWHRFFRKS